MVFDAMTINNSQFVHLHTHSEYSSFDGLSKIHELVMAARQMGFPALALTDHGNIGGWIKFIQECRAKKDKNGKEIEYPTITPILGCEFYLSRNHTWKNKEKQPDGRKGNRHINLYAKNWEGYKNLCSLSEKSWVDGYYYRDPRIDIDLLGKHSQGLMCGSACLASAINANLLYDRYDQSKKLCSIFKDMFGDGFFLEIMYHGIADEARIIPDIFKLSSEMNIPIAATQDSHYIKKSQAKTQEVLMCMSTSTCLSNPKHLHFPYDEFYVKNADEMYKIFGKTPQVLYNTLALAEQINTPDIENNLFGGMRLPEFALPEEFTNPYDYLKKLSIDGMKKLGWNKSERHVERLKVELADLKIAYDNNNYDFSTYLLIVRDYIEFARNKGIIIGAGRGSGYGSVLLRCIGVCYGPDPLEYSLLWERFLGFDDKKFILEKDFGYA